jgi:hypothetical protein
MARGGLGCGNGSSLAGTSETYVLGKPRFQKSEHRQLTAYFIEAIHGQ